MRARKAVLADAVVAGAALLIAWATLAPHGPVADEDAARRFCIWCGDSRLTDAIANVALFVPLGFGLLLRGVSMRRAIAVCVLYTLAIETFQYFGLPAGRVASVSDVLTNSAGAVAGALFVRYWRLFAFPAHRHARWLAAGWTAVCSAVFLASGWAVSSPTWRIERGTSYELSNAIAALDVLRGGAIRLGPMPFTPGFGWFSASVTGAAFNGVAIPHSGSGPVILVASGLGEIDAKIEVMGRDARDEDVPMVYMHSDVSAAPIFMLSQRGNDVSLRATSRGEGVGMTPLVAVLRDVLRAAPVGAADAWAVSARATPALLEIAAGSDTAVLRRTATTGWALIQSLIPVSDVRGVWLTGLWLCGLLFPLGFWAWCSKHWRAEVIPLTSIITVAAIQSTVYLYGVSTPPLWQWMLCVAAFACGILAAQLTSSKRTFTE